MSPSLPRSDAMAVSLAMARPAEAHEILEGVGLTMALDAERPKRLDVMHVERLAKLGRRDATVHAAPVSLAGFPSRTSPRRTVGKLLLGVAVAPVAVLLPLRSPAVAERSAVARFRAESTGLAPSEREWLLARITDAASPDTVASRGVVTGSRAELAAPEFYLGRLDVEAGAAVAASTLNGHRSSLLRCHGPGCYQHRRAFVRPDFTAWQGGDHRG